MTIFENYNKNCILEIKFQNPVYACHGQDLSSTLNLLANYFGADFSEIKFWKVNKIPKIFILKNSLLHSIAKKLFIYSQTVLCNIGYCYRVEKLGMLIISIVLYGIYFLTKTREILYINLCVTT